MNESLIMKMNKQQLEMGLAGNFKSNCRPIGRQRRKRAQWWFSQMRVLVNSAIDWNAAPSARSEQTSFPLSPGEWRRR